MQPVGEYRKEGKRQGQGQRKTQHPYGRPQKCSPNRRFDQEGTDDGPGARERNKGEGKGHKKQTSPAPFIGLAIGFVGPGRGEGDFEGPQEGKPKDQEHPKEHQVKDDVAGHVVQGIGTK